jgi:riboflavin transporter FmnP
MVCRMCSCGAHKMSGVSMVTGHLLAAADQAPHCASLNLSHNMPFYCVMRDTNEVCRQQFQVAEGRTFVKFSRLYTVVVEIAVVVAFLNVKKRKADYG